MAYVLSVTMDKGPPEEGGLKKLTGPTKNCCIFSESILILESSRGGNSHQSETNLIKKTPEAKPPRRPQFSRAKRFRAKG
jgi:hypothetical protein